MEKVLKNTNLLLHPTIPHEIAGISPRTLNTKSWWNVIRQQAYAHNNFHCCACGIHKSKDPYHNWLEAHQIFDYDFENKFLIYVGVAALCHRCHRFIHIGLCSKIDGERKFNDVLFYGLKNLNMSLDNFESDKIAVCKKVESLKGWKLLFDGNLYSYKEKDFYQVDGKFKYSDLLIEEYKKKVVNWNLFEYKRKIRLDD